MLGPKHYNTPSHWNDIYTDEIKDNINYRDNEPRHKEVYHQLKDCDKILDVGCGRGHFIDYCLKRRKFIVGCDQSSVGVEGKGFVCDAYCIFTKEVDGISAQELIEHLEYPEKFVKEMARIGKRICITTPLYKPELHSGEHYREYTVKELKELLGKYFKNIGHKIIMAEYGKCIVMWGDRK